MSAANFREVNRVMVTSDLCDELGHMNIQHYYATLSDGMFNVMELIGMAKEDISTRRTSFALYKEEAEFIQELSEGDEFYMATALEHVGTKSMVFQNRFYLSHNDQLVYKTKFISVFMDLAARAGMAIPEETKTNAVKALPAYVSDA